MKCNPDRSIPLSARSLRPRRLFGIGMLIAGLAFSLQACRFYREKSPGDGQQGGASGQLSYALVRDRVLGPRCVSCHGSSGGINLESYAAVKQNLAAVTQAALVDRIMPPNARLTSSESDLLSAWIKAGAPEAPIGGSPGATTSPTPGSAAAEDLDPLSYAYVRAKVFMPYCIRCHGNQGRVSLKNYASTMQSLEAIREAALIRRVMPPRSSLPREAADILTNWIQAGGPEHRTGGAIGTGPGSGPPGLEELKPGFVSIRKLVLSKRCLGCHIPTGTAARVPLDSLRSILESPRQLVVKGRPDDSRLFQSITRSDSAQMPPPGTERLSEREIAVVRQWIELGAPANEPLPAFGPAELTWDNLRAKVFAPRCIACHGTDGGVDLEIYATVRSDLARVALAALADRTMPPTDPLAQEQLDLLAAWIRAGAPETERRP